MLQGTCRQSRPFRHYCISVIIKTGIDFQADWLNGDDWHTHHVMQCFAVELMPCSIHT